MNSVGILTQNHIDDPLLPFPTPEKKIFLGGIFFSILKDQIGQNILLHFFPQEISILK